VPGPEETAPDSGPTPRITVVIPCYNDGRFLVEATGSVAEPEPIDVVVVDDCSTDPETKDVLVRLGDDGVRILRHEQNGGVSVARNTGLRAARTQYLFPLDADDLAVPGALSAMADKLDADRGAAVCFGDYVEFGPHELVRAVPRQLDVFRLAYVNEYPVSSLFRRADLLSVGGWHQLAPGYEDWNLWLSLVEHGYRGVHLGPGAPTYRRRLHGERMLTIAKRQHRSHYREIRAAHPGVFGNIGRYRKASDLALHRKFLYPIVYGSRPRFAFERPIKRLLDRAGIWTLKR
jgi:glycosyltransferase involved in cell wall biosynthesis